MTRCFEEGGRGTWKIEWLTKVPTKQKERIEPITGPGAEDYKGKGMIQSAPRGFKFEDEEEDEEEE